MTTYTHRVEVMDRPDLGASITEMAALRTSLPDGRFVMKHLRNLQYQGSLAFRSPACSRHFYTVLRIYWQVYASKLTTENAIYNDLANFLAIEHDGQHVVAALLRDDAVFFLIDHASPRSILATMMSDICLPRLSLATSADLESLSSIIKSLHDCTRNLVSAGPTFYAWAKAMFATWNRQQSQKRKAEIEDDDADQEPVRRMRTLSLHPETVVLSIEQPPPASMAQPRAARVVHCHENYNDSSSEDEAGSQPSPSMRADPKATINARRSLTDPFTTVGTFQQRLRNVIHRSADEQDNDHVQPTIKQEQSVERREKSTPEGPYTPYLQATTPLNQPREYSGSALNRSIRRPMQSTAEQMDPNNGEDEIDHEQEPNNKENEHEPNPQDEFSYLDAQIQHLQHQKQQLQATINVPFPASALLATESLLNDADAESDQDDDYASWDAYQASQCTAQPSPEAGSRAADGEDEEQHLQHEEVYIKQEEISDDEGVAEDGNGGVAVEEQDGEVKLEEERVPTSRPRVLGTARGLYIY